MRIISPRPVEELAESLVDSWRSVNECTARFLREVYEFDLRKAYREWHFSDTAEFLDFKCGISRATAREKVRVAKCLVVLEKVEAAFASGELSYSKVRALTRGAKLASEDELLAFALTHPASHVERRVKEIRNGSAAVSSGDAMRAHEDRHLLTSRGSDCGRVELSAELSAEDAGVVMEALERLKEEIWTSGLEGEGRWNDASLAADALVLMAKRSLSGCFRGNAGMEEDLSEDDSREDLAGAGEAPHSHLVTVHVEESALRGEGGASDLPVETVRRLLCDGAAVGLVENAEGEPLSIGRKRRTVPTGMRRALEARDRTCRYPGCSHERWLHAHHVVHWTEGGDTSLDNLVLLCGHHHRLLHEGGFRIAGRSQGGHYFARPDGRPVELEPGRSLEDGEETWALRPWSGGNGKLHASARALVSEAGMCSPQASYT